MAGGTPQKIVLGVSEDVREKAKEELLAPLLEAYKSMIRAFSILCDHAAAGVLRPKEVAEFLTPLAWHVDRIIALISSGTPETSIPYEDLLKKVRSLSDE